jgi:transcriptional regulator with XRE-family HTH domain
MESEKLREILSGNIKKERKKLGLTQEKLAEVAELSSQTINDIEGCRMWVSDKTMSKLARVLHVEAYQLLIPVIPNEPPTMQDNRQENLLFDLEDRVIRNIRQQFKEAIEIATVPKETMSLSDFLCKSTSVFFLAFFQPILATCNSLPDKELAQSRKEFRWGKMNQPFYLHKI